MALEIITSIDLDLTRPNFTVVHAKQYDSSGRKIRAHLLNGGVPWAVPSGVYPVIRFRKTDRLGGFYDTDENGDYAIAFPVSGDRSYVDLTLALQALTTAGTVFMEVNFYSADAVRITSFSWKLDVEPAVLPDSEIVSSEYYNALTEAASIVVVALEDAKESLHDDYEAYSAEMGTQVNAAEAAASDAEEAKTYAQLFTGAPRAASTASGMTDHSLIYVYTGTTSGSLTNGHWYYWNGTAWADGGVYNATALTTDTTLSVAGAAADAAACGDLKSAIHGTAEGYEPIFYNLVEGEYVNESDGSFVTYAGWHRTDYIEVTPGERIYFTNTKRTVYNYFYQADKSPLIATTVPVGTLSSFVVPADAKFLVYSNSSNIRPEFYRLSSVNDKTLMETRKVANSWEVGKRIFPIRQDLVNLNNYNLIPWTDLFNSTNLNGIDWTITENGIHVEGTSTADSNKNIFSSSSSFPSWIEKGKKYYIYYEDENVNLRIFYYIGSNLTEQVRTFHDTSFTIPEEAVGVIIRLNVQPNKTVDTTVLPIITSIPRLRDVNRTISDHIGENRDIQLYASDFYHGSIGNNGAENTYHAGVRAINKGYLIAKDDMWLVSNDDYWVSVFYYDSYNSFLSASDWVINGRYRIKAGSRYRLLLSADGVTESPGSDLLDIADIVSHFYTVGNVGVYEKPSIVLRNPDAEERLVALKRHVDLTTSPGSVIRTHNSCFAIAHISDVHVDNIRFRSFIDFCDFYKSYINAKICTGDYVSSPVSAEITHMKEEAKKVLFCVGNHEKGGFNNTKMSNTEVYNAFDVAAIQAANNAVTNTSVPEGERLYYYVDYVRTAELNTGTDAYKVRLIVLNTCDNNQNSTVNRYSPAQITWLIEVLKDAATNGFSVLLASHYGESDVLPNDKGFYFRNEHISGERLSEPYIENIITAFRRSERYNPGVVNVRNSDPSDASVEYAMDLDADFRNYPNGQFFAWMVGHWHNDQIGYSVKHPDLLYLCITCGVFINTLTYPADADNSKYGDLPRVEGTRTEDAFNIYSFDPINKLCKVMRVGSDLNDEMVPRKYACFDTQPSVT